MIARRQKTPRRFAGLSALGVAALALCLWSNAAQAGAAPSAGAEKAGAHTAEERAALQDLQSVLESMAADGGEDRRNREQAFRTLARIREALNSWATSGDYYRALLKRSSSNAVSYYVLSGLAIAEKAEHGHARAVIDALKKDEAEAASARSGDVRNQRNRILNSVQKAAGAFARSAGYGGPRLRPMKGLRQKEVADPFLAVHAPAWIGPPQPKVKGKGKGKAKDKGKGKDKAPPDDDADLPATSIRFPEKY